MIERILGTGEKNNGRNAKLALAGLATLIVTGTVGTIIHTTNENLPNQQAPTEITAKETKADILLKPQGYINDFAHLLTADDIINLGIQLIKLEEDTTAEVTVVTINSLNSASIEDYAVRLFENWKIGKTSKDNGILLLISMQEKKMKIEIGYGLESYLTDGQAGRILDNSVLPYFRTGDYANGIKAGINAIDTCLRDGYTNNKLYRY